ncbi:MAG: hypothetical protein KDN05_22805 [Verrucomicrobiae bacterium]|nr:hypothetical protein [Verrucomicrobiae bacterium]
MHETAILVIAGVLAGGVVAQWLGWRLRVPARATTQEALLAQEVEAGLIAMEEFLATAAMASNRG